MNKYKHRIMSRAMVVSCAVLLCLTSLWATTACTRNIDDTSITTDTGTATDTVTVQVTTAETTTATQESTVIPDTTAETTVVPSTLPMAPKTVTTSPPAANNNPAPVQSIEQEVAALVNQARRQNGLKELTLSPELSNVARIKANDMATNRYFSHTSPTYGSPFDMMKQFGISYRTAGENIAMGQTTAQQVFNGWMNSEGHRANILNPNFSQIGVGYTANGHYWVQMFIG
ncbi:MAG: serine protease [Clostridiales bacterium]|nr:serine protease [Clostridiales bacterium]